MAKVYGTLKRGFTNYQRYLGLAEAWRAVQASLFVSAYCTGFAFSARAEMKFEEDIFGALGGKFPMDQKDEEAPVI